jgi:membrane protein YqaA with SNARE-associated domain
MAFGSFVSDAFMFPVPPQFYMLTAVAAGAPQVQSITVVCVTSVVASNVAYLLAGRIAHVRFFRERIARTRPQFDPLFARYGVRAMILGAVLPIPYSLLCYLAGLYRIPYRIYALLVLARVPRLLVFYFLIRAGWG